ncbi:hypothetical protein [Acidithiobacillus ferridurans]|uniref:Uncharacterized protein n=1 Tax=Acidithiobacillus ferridurans TaxID=1232575 RepID=A0A8X8G775_ACIFI|nr:hypothetical protein [Acidithiobacillus ferridurans]MBU2716967.1 hypothetical protein [Acidithiobacillus ferridurans]MBU2721813.1 hypothetical protein [Acidithiobacillus ferridurans]MBU2726933.1 hypothetical protein [Acidithiobacillus ferridurans]
MTKDDLKPSKGRGGKRANAGRKAADGVTNTIQVMVSLTPEHREKFKKLGGSLWLRRMIDEQFDR